MRNGLIRGVTWGAAAGAAGTTALNGVTYLDMLARARPASSTPHDTVEAVAEKAGVDVPGDPDEREHRVDATGQLMGLLAGVGTGAALGLAYGLGWRPRRLAGVAVAMLGALVAGNGPMTALGITDPRSWSSTDWVSDVVPHAAFGVVTAAVLRGRFS